MLRSGMNKEEAEGFLRFSVEQEGTTCSWGNVGVVSGLMVVLLKIEYR